MSLPAEPPRYGPTGSWEAFVAMTRPIKLGAKGWQVFALQCMVGTARDGDFGPKTYNASIGWQSANGLVADGIVGPKTQAKMLKLVAADVESDYRRLPKGMLDGFAIVEGGNILAATNWYSPPGSDDIGVDCGPGQLRIKGPPFSRAALELSFNPSTNFEKCAQAFTARIINYASRRPSLDSRKIVEMAVLAHNAPFMAEQVIRNGRLSTPDRIAQWTTIPEQDRHLHGNRIRYTHAEWAVEYPGRILRGLTY